MNSEFTVVVPLKVTDANLHSSNIPETDHAAWASGTTYGKGDRAIRDHSIWESLQGSNTANTPESSPLWWVRVGATNRWRAFDESVNTQTTGTGSPPKINYKFRPGDDRIDTIAALNLADVSTITVKVTEIATSTVVYNETTSALPIPDESGWWAWFFAARGESLTQFIARDLPALADVEIEIDIEGVATAAVGVVLLGKQQTFGLGAQYGARIGIIDYSRKERNDFGDMVVVQRNYARRASFNLLIRRQEVDPLYALLGELRTTACLWIGSDIYESTVIYGFYKSFEILIPYRDYSEVDLELEGLT